MKNLLTFLAWPALAGFSFAVALLLAPWLAEHVPSLSSYLATPLSRPGSQVEAVSYSSGIKKAAPAVVSINSLNQVERIQLRPSLFRSWVLETQNDQSNSLGSGVIISKDGYIVTSYHVFFGNDPNALTKPPQITVTFNDGQEVEGNLVQLDAKNDLALIKVERDNLPYLTLSDSRKLEVGDVVLAIGNPHNIGQSVTSGIISALWRKGDSFVIQTDAAINPGNSGGALIDVNGDLIGINSTIVSESGGSEGISFAIAAREAMQMLDDLRKQYASDGETGFLGVNIDQAVGFEQKSSRTSIQGFSISSVMANGPADKAGIQAGDVIVAVGDQKIRFNQPINPKEAQKEGEKIRNLPSFKPILFTVFRGSDGKGQEQLLQIPVILGKGVRSGLDWDASEASKSTPHP